MIDTLLFDLDGTLVGMNTEEFVQHYMGAISTYARDYLEPKQFVNHLLSASYAMIEDTRPDRFNREKFIEHFFCKVQYEVDELMPVFDKFYSKHFTKLKQYTSTVPMTKEVLDYAVLQGYNLVLATNPVFPKAAVEERMRWAGIEKYPFKLITTYEIMHHAKPHLAYYQEILKIIDKRPSQCMMIGNDSLEDMAAKRLGITTFLVDNYQICHDTEITPDYQGSFADLMKLLEQLQQAGIAASNS